MDTTNLLFERANLLFQQRRISDAMKEIKNLLSQDPDHSDALALLARCHFENKQYAEGISRLHDALRIAPHHAYYFYLLGYGEYQQDKYPAAVKYLNQAISLDPYHPAFFGLLAFVLLSENKFGEALIKADEGLAIDPEDTTCLNARARALNKLNRVEDAVETMRGSLASDPENEITHNTIGWNYLEKGKHKDARGHFLEALRIDPGYDAARQGLKESLKSSIPPYKWLLQLSFWLQNKGKNFRLYFFIGIFVAVRLISGATSGNKDFESIGLVIVICYVLFVASSWIMNPMANAFLLFHKIGKHALDPQERWNAIGFLASLAAGATLLIVSSTFNNPAQATAYLQAGLAAASLCIVLGHMEFPVTLKNNGLSQWLSILMVLTALTGIGMALAVIPAYEFVLIAYMALFVIYSWTSSF